MGENEGSPITMRRPCVHGSACARATRYARGKIENSISYTMGIFNRKLEQESCRGRAVNVFVS